MQKVKIRALTITASGRRIKRDTKYDLSPREQVVQKLSLGVIEAARTSYLEEYTPNLHERK